jgi:hypothetical protein
MALHGTLLGGLSCHLARPGRVPERGFLGMGRAGVARAQTTNTPGLVSVDSACLQPTSGPGSRVSDRPSDRGIAIRSIFSICNALCQGGLLTLPDAPPSVCYPCGRHRQRRGPKPGGQRNLDPRIGRERASQHGDCQHHNGRGPVVRGKVNPGEVLTKAVIRDKPKMLSGLNQNGPWSGTGACHSPVADAGPPAEKHDLAPGRSRR